MFRNTLLHDTSHCFMKFHIASCNFFAPFRLLFLNLVFNLNMIHIKSRNHWTNIRKNIKKIHTHTWEFRSMYIVCHKDIKLFRNIADNIYYRCEIQQKISETMNVSIHSIKKPTKLLISIAKYMEKYIKQLKYLKKWDIIQKSRKTLKNLHIFIRNFK